MAGIVFKQKNGLYGRWSSVIDCPTHFNMTEEDYYNYRLEIAKEQIKEDMKKIFKDAPDFDDYFKGFVIWNMTKEELSNFLKMIDSSLTVKDFMIYPDDFKEEDDVIN